MIAEKRKELNFTQKSFADILGVSQQCVAKWEKGLSFPRAELLPKIASALNCTIDELLREEVPEEKNESNSQTFANLEN